jgi:hypothetical protein
MAKQEFVSHLAGNRPVHCRTEHNIHHRSITCGGICGAAEVFDDKGTEEPLEHGKIDVIMDVGDSDDATAPGVEEGTHFARIGGIFEKSRVVWLREDVDI